MKVKCNPKINIDDIKSDILNADDVAKILGCGLTKARELMNSKGFPLIPSQQILKVYKPALKLWLMQNKEFEQLLAKEIANNIVDKPKITLGNFERQEKVPKELKIKIVD